MNKRVGLALVLCCLIGSSAWAQQSAKQRMEKQMREIEDEFVVKANNSMQISERALLDYGGIINMSYVAADDKSAVMKDWVNPELQLYMRLNIDGVHEFYGRMRASYTSFIGDPYPGTQSSSWSVPWLDQWWYSFDLGRAVAKYDGDQLRGTLQLKIGRQFFNVSEGLVLSNNMYAARLIGQDGPIEMEVFGAYTPPCSFVDFDSSRPQYDRNTQRLFAGGKVAWRPVPDFQPYVYAVKQWDDNSPSEDVLFQTYTTKFKYDSYYIGGGVSGLINAVPGLNYGAEVVYEGGHTYSNPFDPSTGAQVTQTLNDISAWAAKLRMGYGFRDLNNTELHATIAAATGSNSRVGSTSNTFGGSQTNSVDTAYNAWGYVNTGVAFAGTFSNLGVLQIGGSTYPLKGVVQWLERMQVGVDGFAFAKVDPYAPYDESTHTKHFLGGEVDLMVNWQITSDFNFNTRYGIFLPGEGIAGPKAVRQFIYVGFGYKF